MVDENRAVLLKSAVLLLLLLLCSFGCEPGDQVQNIHIIQCSVQSFAVAKIKQTNIIVLLTFLLF